MQRYIVWMRSPIVEVLQVNIFGAGMGHSRIPAGTAPAIELGRYMHPSRIPSLGGPFEITSTLWVIPRVAKFTGRRREPLVRTTCLVMMSRGGCVPEESCACSPSFSENSDGVSSGDGDSINDNIVAYIFL
jgi:hypothetical protein